jgi:uncharacterized protein (TIGR02217 family)
VWNWDARPFPAFPRLGAIWGDAGNWSSGQWLNGKGPFLALPAPDAVVSQDSYPTFPVLGMQGWSVHFSPAFLTGIAEHVSGRESRATKMAAPIWEIELTYDLLRMNVPNDELRQIIGFYGEIKGQSQAFLFEPPALSPLRGQVLGIADGVTRTFAFVRSIGGYSEPVAAVSSLAAVYVDGVVLAATQYVLNIGPPASITFLAAPADGAVVAADFGFYLLCRFEDDQEDMEEFANRLFALRSLKLRTVKS